jgi:hypothetical protein
MNLSVEKIAKKNKEKFSVDYEVEGMVFFFTIAQYYVLIDTKYLTHNTLAHEIYHAVIKVTEVRDITDEESQAWLCGKLTQDIYNFLNINNQYIK